MRIKERKMNKFFTLALVGTTVVTFMSSGSAQAADFGYLGTNDGRIGTVDLDTGVFSSIVDTTLNNTLGDIAISNTGVIFANSISATGGNNTLYRVNPNSGVITPVGDTNVNNIAGLAINTNTDVLYGSSFAQAPISGRFLSLNASTGAATTINDIPNFSAAGDLAYNPSTNTFFGTSTTPTNSTLFSIGLDGSSQEIGDIGFDNVYGLILDGSTLYGFTRDGEQLTINTSTGVGTFENNVTGIAPGALILGASPAAVPEPLTILGYMTVVGLGARLKGKLKSKQAKAA